MLVIKLQHVTMSGRNNFANSRFSFTLKTVAEDMNFTKIALLHFWKSNQYYSLIRYQSGTVEGINCNSRFLSLYRVNKKKATLPSNNNVF